MQNLVLPISPSETQERSDSTSQLIKEWLFRFGVEHKEDVAPRLPLWLEAFGGIDAQTLESLFRKTLNTCKFFPKVAEILEHVSKTESNATNEAAEQAWQRALDIRRIHYNPDMPQYLAQALARLPERIRQSARAAGIFREHDSVESLHVWAKKRFLESFIAYGELEQDKYLLPDGEIKNLLAEFAESKALPAPTVDFHGLHERGLEYAERVKEAAPLMAVNRAVTERGNLWGSEETREIAYRSMGEKETDPQILDRIRAQKEALAARGYK
jgi:hypothetical protein